MASFQKSLFGGIIFEHYNISNTYPWSVSLKSIPKDCQVHLPLNGRESAECTSLLLAFSHQGVMGTRYFKSFTISDSLTMQQLGRGHRIAHSYIKVTIDSTSISTVFSWSKVSVVLPITFLLDKLHHQLIESSPPRSSLYHEIRLLVRYEEISLEPTMLRISFAGRFEGLCIIRQKYCRQARSTNKSTKSE